MTLDELAKAILAGPVEDGKRPFEIGPVDRVELRHARTSPKASHYWSMTGATG
jgi:hypothetical protein